MTAEAIDFYAAALQSTSPTAPASPMPWYVHYEDGGRHSLTEALVRWCSSADEVDRTLLGKATGTVIDVGCGPGRLVAELSRQGRHALGLDISPTALRLARRAGATAIRRSVFDPVHGDGLWGTVLLADGNIGIGGKPIALLRRCREFIAPDGLVLVEVEAPGSGSRISRIRLEREDEVSDWFPWAHLDAAALEGAAAQAGLRVRETWEQGGRWFVALEREAGPP